MRHYWCSVQTLAGISLSLLAVAAVLLPRAWQEKADRRSADRSARRSQDSAPVTGRFQRLHWMLDVNPYLWLANRVSQRDVLGPILLGLLILAWLCSLASAVTLDGRQSASGAFVVSFFSAFAIHLVAKYLVAVEATRQLGEDRRSGALELLLVTPLPEAQILSGQQQALRRRSWVLLWTLLFVKRVHVSGGMTASKALHFSRTDRVLFSELFIGGMIVALLDFRALQTVGMCVALRAGRHQRAVLGTLGRVMLVPWAGCFLWFFLSVTNAIRPSQDGLAATFALWFVIGIVCDLYLIAQAGRAWAGGCAIGLQRDTRPERREWFPTPQPSTLAVQSG